LRPVQNPGVPQGQVRALNSTAAAPITIP
jgi:hypothetical protein